MRLAASRLTDWGSAAFVALGVPDDDARLVAGSLVRTSLWGIDSHGVPRLPHYFARLTNGTILSRPRLRFSRGAAAVANLDGGHGLGIVVVHRGMEKAIALAAKAGVGVVGIRDSSHCGAMGLYTRQAAAAGMIGVAFTHTDSLLMTHGGTKPFFGTNPISIGFPFPKKQPLVVDMATSVVPWNRVLNARRTGGTLESGWAADADGRDCTDPAAAVAVRPVGAHKGYALSFLIDMLCGPLNGMAFGPHVTSMYGDLGKKRHLGSLVMALDPSRFAGGKSLAASIARAIREVGAQDPRVRYPGEPEYRAERERTKSGIPVDRPLMRQFADWSERLGIARP